MLSILWSKPLCARLRYCSLVLESAVTLALRELVHEALAEGDLAAVLLDAADKGLVEGHAGVLLRRHLLLHRLLSVLRLLRVLLLLLRGLAGAAVAAATAHHCADALVCDLRTSAEGHTSSHGTHESAAHATAHHGLLGCRLRWGPRRGPGRSRSRSARRATREEAAATAAATASS